MKTIFYILIAISLFFVSCNKENLNENLDDSTDIVDQEQILYESNLAFLNSDWTFDTVEDSLKNQIIGLWLSNEVTYDDTICNDCVGIFTWVIESTGRMGKRNNYYGDNETLYGDWEVDSNKNYIFFSYKEYATGGTLENYRIVTDTINIENLNEINLSTSQFINYPPTTKMDIRFIKLR
jgi:hypothetical protein